MLLGALCPVQLGYEMASLEKGRRLLQKASASAFFSCVIVTGAIMLNLFTTAIPDKPNYGLLVCEERSPTSGIRYVH